jgi:hypothetical protein
MKWRLYPVPEKQFPPPDAFQRPSKELVKRAVKGMLGMTVHPNYTLASRANGRISYERNPEALEHSISTIASVGTLFVVGTCVLALFAWWWVVLLNVLLSVFVFNQMRKLREQYYVSAWVRMFKAVPYWDALDALEMVEEYTDEAYGVIIDGSGGEPPVYIVIPDRMANMKFLLNS